MESTKQKKDLSLHESGQGYLRERFLCESAGFARVLHDNYWSALAHGCAVPGIHKVNPSVQFLELAGVRLGEGPHGEGLLAVRFLQTIGS